MKQIGQKDLWVAMKGKTKTRWVHGVASAVRVTTVEAFKDAHDQDTWRRLVQNAVTAVPDLKKCEQNIHLIGVSQTVCLFFKF